MPWQNFLFFFIFSPYLSLLENVDSVLFYVNSKSKNDTNDFFSRRIRKGFWLTIICGNHVLGILRLTWTPTSCFLLPASRPLIGRSDRTTGPRPGHLPHNFIYIPFLLSVPKFTANLYLSRCRCSRFALNFGTLSSIRFGQSKTGSPELRRSRKGITFYRTYCKNFANSAV